jgi:hypothetical protein
VLRPDVHSLALIHRASASWLVGVICKCVAHLIDEHGE